MQIKSALSFMYIAIASKEQIEYQPIIIVETIQYLASTDCKLAVKNLHIITQSVYTRSWTNINLAT